MRWSVRLPILVPTQMYLFKKNESKHNVKFKLIYNFQAKRDHSSNNNFESGQCLSKYRNYDI